jgi:hypothetical protein
VLHNLAVMQRWMPGLMFAALMTAGSGCALRSPHVATAPASSQEFSSWDCMRLQRELDRVQRRATRVAYAFDERAGNNIIAMSLGMTVFWPALLTMRSTQTEADELATLKGRFEALTQTIKQRACAPLGTESQALRGVVRVGDQLTYEQRAGRRASTRSWTLVVGRVSAQGLELQSAPSDPPTGAPTAVWQFDASGNLVRAPVGPIWPQLLRDELVLGALISGELADPADPSSRARVRGQVVAVGPQVVSNRSVDAAVIDLFGDVQSESASSRLDGVLVVERGSGLLLRLDLNSAHAGFQMQRRLMRIQTQP